MGRPATPLDRFEERLEEGRAWWRIADRDGRNPLDPSFAAARGGRWNPPRSFPTLYFSEDEVTARRNLRAFIAASPYEPEDLRGPVLVGATLPRQQQACDAHSRAGVAAAGLPKTHPLDARGKPVPRSRARRVTTLSFEAWHWS